MARREPELDAILLDIARNADFYLRQLGSTIEHRDKTPIKSLTESSYCLISLLKGFDRDFALPGEWPDRINEMYKEFEYLRALGTNVLWSGRIAGSRR